MVPTVWFCFKQKTAYELRISDGSSDVCSSDLKHRIAPSPRPQIRYHAPMLLRARILAPDKDANPLLSRRLRRLSTLLLLGLSGFALTAASVTPQAREWYRARLGLRSEEHTSELQSLMRISYAVFCLKKQKTLNKNYN